MKTFTRYAILEFLKILLLALAGITLFMFVIVGAREAIRHGLGPGPMLKIMPYVLPESMRYSIPAAALLTACTVFGRMSGDNEVVALKSLGISPTALIIPALFVSFLVSAAGVWINDLSVSWGVPGRQRMIVESIEQIVYGVLRTPPRSYSIDGLSITVKAVDEGQLILPIVSIQNGPDEPPTRISADRAKLYRDPEHNTLTISFTNAVLEGPDGLEVYDDQFDRVIPLNNDQRDGHPLRSASDYPLRDLPLQVAEQQGRIDDLERAMAAEAAFAMLAGNIATLDDPRWEQRHKQLNRARYRLNRLRIEPWRRWSNGFSCFFFVLVGIPLSIRRRNADFISNFFFCFVPILLVYYPLMMIGVERAKDGALPLQAVWLGNLAMCVWGIWLMRRVIRF